MAEPLDLLRQTLKRHNQSLTHPREAVFLALQNQEPLTMQQVVVACSQIDRASVYRTIALFEQLGVVQRLPMGWKYKLELSDAFQHHHHHLTCNRCGRTYTLPEDAELETRLRLLAAHEHFKMQDHQLEIQGICQTCRQAA
jgi:Fe2+ or Zn2+ uptake regulation protein